MYVGLVVWQERLIQSNLSPYMYVYEQPHLQQSSAQVMMVGDVKLATGSDDGGNLKKERDLPEG